MNLLATVAETLHTNKFSFSGRRHFSFAKIAFPSSDGRVNKNLAVSGRIFFVGPDIVQNKRGGEINYCHLEISGCDGEVFSGAVSTSDKHGREVDCCHLEISGCDSQSFSGQYPPPRWANLGLDVSGAGPYLRYTRGGRIFKFGVDGQHVIAATIRDTDTSQARSDFPGSVR